MEALLGFRPDIWDWLAIGAVLLLVILFLIVAMFLLGLPGKIAIARKHPDADAINVMGWAGFLAVVPWIQAFMWAFKPTNVVDVRRFPRAEQRAIDEEIARLKGKTPPGKTPEPKGPTGESKK